MTHSADGQTLLDELDRRQNDVLRALDDLDARIESLILEYSARNRMLASETQQPVGTATES